MWSNNTMHQFIIKSFTLNMSKIYIMIKVDIIKILSNTNMHQGESFLHLWSIIITLMGSLHNMCNMHIYVRLCTFKLNCNVLSSKQNYERFKIPYNTSWCSLCITPLWVPCTTHVNIYIKKKADKNIKKKICTHS